MRLVSNFEMTACCYLWAQRYWLIFVVYAPPYFDPLLWRCRQQICIVLARQAISGSRLEPQKGGKAMRKYEVPALKIAFAALIVNIALHLKKEIKKSRPL